MLWKAGRTYRATIGSPQIVALVTGPASRPAQRPDEERPGPSILGSVDGHRVVLGKASWAAGGDPLPPAAAANP